MSHPADPQACSNAADAIVVVDDNPDILRVVTRVLAHTNHPVVACATPSEALAKIGEGRVSVLVSDVSMPEMSGFALMRLVHALRPGLPVVLMTGTPELDFERIAIERGAFASLQKPFCAEELRSTVECAFQQCSRQ